MAVPIVKRVDHLMIRTPNPEALIALFTQRLQLPQAWSLAPNYLFSSTGIFLGNLNLDIRHFRGSGARAGLLQAGQAGTGGVPTANRPRLYGVGFELEPYDRSLPELDARGIPHTPPMPFMTVDDQGWQMTTWTSVFLGGLLGDSTARRMFFALSQHTSKETWERGSLPSAANRPYGLPYIFNRVFPRSLTYAVEYNPVWRTRNITEQATHLGLDVLRVYELSVGVRHIEQARSCWKSLLDGHPEVDNNVWKLPGDLHIRLTPHENNELLGMIWQVNSLNRAAQFLHRQGMFKEQDGVVMIDPHAIQGLKIQLMA